MSAAVADVRLEIPVANDGTRVLPRSLSDTSLFSEMNSIYNSKRRLSYGLINFFDRLPAVIVLAFVAHLPFSKLASGAFILATTLLFGLSQLLCDGFIDYLSKRVHAFLQENGTASELASCLRRTIGTVVIGSVIIMAVGFFGSESILQNLFSQDMVVAHEASTFIKVACLAVLPHHVSNTMISYLFSRGVIAAWSCAIFSSIIMTLEGYMKALVPADCFSVNWADYSKELSGGLRHMAAIVCSPSFILVVLTFIAGFKSVDNLVAFGIARMLFELFYVNVMFTEYSIHERIQAASMANENTDAELTTSGQPATHTANNSNTFVSHQHIDAFSEKRWLVINLGLAFAMELFVGVCLYCLIRFAGSWFSSDSDVQEYLQELWPMASVALILEGMNAMWRETFRQIPSLVRIITASSNWIVGLLLAVVISRLVKPVNGLWCGVNVGLAFCNITFITAACVMTIRKQVEQTAPQQNQQQDGPHPPLSVPLNAGGGSSSNSSSSASTKASTRASSNISASASTSASISTSTSSSASATVTVHAHPNSSASRAARVYPPPRILLPSSSSDRMVSPSVSVHDPTPLSRAVTPTLGSSPSINSSSSSAVEDSPRTSTTVSGSPGIDLFNKDVYREMKGHTIGDYAKSPTASGAMTISTPSPQSRSSSTPTNSPQLVEQEQKHEKPKSSHATVQTNSKSTVKASTSSGKEKLLDHADNKSYGTPSDDDSEFEHDEIDSQKLQRSPSIQELVSEANQKEEKENKEKELPAMTTAQMKSSNSNLSSSSATTKTVQKADHKVPHERSKKKVEFTETNEVVDAKPKRSREFFGNDRDLTAHLLNPAQRREATYTTSATSDRPRARDRDTSTTSSSTSSSSSSTSSATTSSASCSSSSSTTTRCNGPPTV